MTALVDIREALAAAMALSPASHPHVGTEHLALVAWEGPGGLAEIARDNRVDALRLASILGNCCPNRQERPAGAEPAITVRTATALAVASQIAFADGDERIRPGHILLALLEDPGAIAWQGVRRAGLTLSQVCDGVLARREAPAPTPGPRALRNLLVALGSPIVAWAAWSETLAQEPDDQEARQSAEAARAYVADLAGLGARVGLLRPGEAMAMAGNSPEAAKAAFSSAGLRIHGGPP